MVCMTFECIWMCDRDLKSFQNQFKEHPHKGSHAKYAVPDEWNYRNVVSHWICVEPLIVSVSFTVELVVVIVVEL